MKIISFILIFSALFKLITSCRKLGGCKDESLSLQKSDHISNLRIDGFYYGDSSSTYDNKVLFKVLILYKNGLIFYPGVSEYSNMNIEMNQIVDSPPSDTKYFFGLFKQSSDKIEIEKWLPRQCGYWVEYRSVKVLNDTTFQLTFQKQSYKAEKNSGVINQIYHFRAFSPKPDSTNNFIK